MRIIAGEHRGRRIAAPPGERTRPMLDRVREALFSTLGDLVADARVLDLFAGSGSLGLEALSRGATHARLVERDPRALAVLKANVELLGVGDRARVVRADALEPGAWHEADAERTPYDLVFLDPPYALLDDPHLRPEVLAAVERLLGRDMQPGGRLVLHAPARTLEMLRLRAGESELRKYGGSALCYIAPGAGRPQREPREGGEGA
jgi:16S rRNA (guanine966-N2)-methyltransferase